MGLSYYFRERAGAHPCRDRPYGRRSLSLTELWSVRFKNAPIVLRPAHKP